MVQDQLIDYISAQMKSGASRDMIKSTLVSAGWQAVDVEDSLKKIEGAKPASPAVAAMPAVGPKPMGPSSLSATTPAMSSSPASMPAMASPSSPAIAPKTMPASSSTSFTAAKPVGASSPATTATATKTSEPQTIRVSDLVSSASSSPTNARTGTPDIKKQPSMESVAAAQPAMDPKMKSTNAMMGGSIAPQKQKGGGLGWIVAVIGILLFGGAAGYFYMQNSTLSGQVATLTTQSGAISGQLATLKSQLNASTTDLSSQITSLSATNNELLANLLLFVVDPSESTSTVMTLTGTVAGGGKAVFSITTSYGAKAFVKNSTDAKVSAALTPLVGKSAQVSGTILQGSANIMVTGVNGTALQ